MSLSIQVTPPWIHTTYSYKDPAVKHCLHQIKYYHRRDMIPPLVANTITEQLCNFIGDNKQVLLVPIPMHRTRTWSRGYNHALHIAQSYGTQLLIPVNGTLLARKRATSQQAKIKNKSEREKNVRDAFMIQQEHAPPLATTIVLVDDTTTTHATLCEARNVLEQAGYKHIRALTLAH